MQRGEQFLGLHLPFDIRQFRCAIAAANHESFYQAARALHIGQSTLSRSSLNLERAIDTPNFERSRAGVTMTSAGKRSFVVGRDSTSDLDVDRRPRRQAGRPRRPPWLEGDLCRQT
ncbi:LysR family transcriptional regulator [Rhizobium leguminosarum]|uniref:helix-turn-helix domain-containing protein n=1 Tax=Rhizobium leguminosarum TaxID=384 RepID=UPI001C98ADCB|nr:LysR family transcriptional regulator [Rhizobium leguminosarum]